MGGNAGDASASFPLLEKSSIFDTMKNKIALEEHFAIDLTIADSQVYARPEVWTTLIN